MIYCLDLLIIGGNSYKEAGLRHEHTDWAVATIAGQKGQKHARVHAVQTII